jgi:hypothetical protein
MDADFSTVHVAVRYLLEPELGGDPRRGLDHWQDHLLRRLHLGTREAFARFLYPVVRSIRVNARRFGSDHLFGGDERSPIGDASRLARIVVADELAE